MVDLLIGEAYAGEGGNAAHINVLAGPRSGPLGGAFAAALAGPRPGHIPFLAVLQPNIPIHPPTLMVNKASIADDRHGTLTWGAAQAGVAVGAREALDAGALDGQNLDEWVMIVAAWNDPTADDEDAVYANNRTAMREALLRAAGKLGYAGDYRDHSLEARNPFFMSTSNSLPSTNRS